MYGFVCGVFSDGEAFGNCQMLLPCYIIENPTLKMCLHVKVELNIREKL